MKILLLGKDGQIGWELQRSLASLGELLSCGRREADFTKPDLLRALVRHSQPDVIVNAAAYTAVDRAEVDVEIATCINAVSVGVLAEEARRLGAWLVHYSTDYVFDGKSSIPYTEEDAANPLSVYGKSKFEGEQLVCKSRCRHLILRTSWAYGRHGSNFVKTVLRMAREKEELNIVADRYGAPTSAELIADATALALYKILQTDESSFACSGTYHLTASGYTSWYDYAKYVLHLVKAKSEFSDINTASVVPIPASAYPQMAARPANSRLSTAKLVSTFNLHLPDWRCHVQRTLDELIKQGNIYETQGNHSCRRLRDSALPGDACSVEATAADLR